MAEQIPAPQAATDQHQPVVTPEKIYVKDMSIEIPHAPQIFLEQEPPGLETQLNISAANFAEGLYEVVVTATVTTRIRDKVVFLVELGQGGIFQLRNIPAEQIDAVVGVHCASVLYPYLRANVSDLITRAGFPALHLPIVNFDTFYAQRVQEAQAAQQAAQGTPGAAAVPGPTTH
jgi:preprotein translocase subunit SecB